MPACPVEHEDDLPVWLGSCLAGKGGQFSFKERDTHARRQVEERAARGGMHEAHQIAPGVAVLHRGDRALANRRPDAAQERFQADAMLIRGPQFHGGVGKRRRHLAAAVALAFFEGVLCRHVRLHMLWSRQLLAMLEALQIGVAQRVGDRTANALTDPRRDLGAGPALPARHGRRHGRRLARSSSCCARLSAGGARWEVVWRRLRMPSGPSLL